MTDVDEAKRIVRAKYPRATIFRDWPLGPYWLAKEGQGNLVCLAEKTSTEDAAWLAAAEAVQRETTKP